MGSAIRWISAQTAKCHFAVCAKTGGTMSVSISHDEIAARATGLLARVRLWGNSQKNRPSCFSCRLPWVACFLRERCHGLWRRRQHWLHPTVGQYLPLWLLYLAASSLRGARTFHNALMHVLARSLTKDISMTLATFPNRALCALRISPRVKRLMSVVIAPYIYECSSTYKGILR